MCVCVPCLSFPLHMAAVCTLQPAWTRHHLCSPGWEYIEFQALGGGGAEHPNLGGIWPLQDSAPTGARGKASASVGVYFFHPVEEMPEEKGNY